MTPQLIDRIRAIVDDGSMSRSGLARAEGLHANSLRDLESPGWNPTAETLRKHETSHAQGSERSPKATSEENIPDSQHGPTDILVAHTTREKRHNQIKRQAT